MANYLKMARIEAIRGLLRAGWPHRRIARELQVHRETVARYAREGAVAGFEVAAGPEAPSGPKPAKVTAGSRSGCHGFLPVITQKLDAGLSAQRIFQDLSSDHGFAGSYSSVKRFVRGLSQKRPLPFRRMECAPGEEAQADFGCGPWIVEGDSRRRSHVFRIVLSHSRKGYSEAVYRQDTETFIRCLENAFRAFGGVPRTLVIDNLKAAVTRALVRRTIIFAAGRARWPTRASTGRRSARWARFSRRWSAER